MPPFHTYPHPHVRDATEIDADSSSIPPGQRVSIDGGIDSKKNIIAMIIAIVLFIVVVVLYQYLTITWARREHEVRANGRHRRRRSQSSVPLHRKVLALVKRWFLSLKRLMSPAADMPSPRPSTSTSMENLLKVRPRQHAKRRLFLNLPCLTRGKYPSKSKRQARQALRPLLLHSDLDYVPRSPIDEKTYEILRTPDAFAEYSDPVRNMNFVRMEDEVHRRKERDEVWYEEPLNSPVRPIGACVAPLAIRKDKKSKSSVLREGNDMEYEWTPPSPERVLYPSREPVPPAAPPSPVRNPQSLSFYAAYSACSHRPLSSIDEEPEPPTPRSFFEIDDDDDREDKVRKRRKKFSIKFPFPPSTRTSISKDEDVFTIGSVSSSSDCSEPSELGPWMPPPK